MKPVTTTASSSATGRARMLLALVLAALLMAAAPALAQEGVDEEGAAKEEGTAAEVVEEEGIAKEETTKREATREGPTQGGGPVTATGVLVGPVDDGDLDPTPEYRLTDEATGTNYVLVSGFVDLEPFAGQRVTISGVPIGGADNAPPALNVTQIQPAGGGGNGPEVNDKATLSFELTVYGDPPAGVAFYGNVRTGEGGPGLFVPLTDPDGDRVYTGSRTVDRFGPGPRPVPPGTEPVSFPVQIVQEIDPEGISVIKDFGTVKLDGDKTFEASASFPVDDCPLISPTPELCPGPGGGGVGTGNGGSDDGGSSNDGSSNDGSSNGGSSGSGGSDDGGSGSGSGGSGSSVSGSSSGSGGVPGGIANSIRGVLPSTGGGTALWVLGAGILLVAGGLLVRKVFR